MCLFPCIYPLFDHLLISVWVPHICLTLWAMIGHHLPAQVVPAPAAGSPLGWLLCDLRHLRYCGGFSNQFLTFRRRKVLQARLVSFPPRSRDRPLLHGAPGSFLLRTLSKTKTWPLMSSVSPGCQCFRAPSADRARK